MNLPVNQLSFIQNRQIGLREKLATMFPKELIQDFFLRSEVYLENGKTNYDILLGKEAGKTAGPTERLLQTNDAFAPNAVALRVKKDKFVSDKAYPGNVKLYSYADDGVFDGAAVGGFTEAECMQPIYNSDFSLYADGKELIYKLDTSQMEYIPENRFTATRIHAGTGSLPGFEGFLPLSKDFVLLGGNENRGNLDLRGANVGTIEADPTANTPDKVEQNKVVLIFYGLIVRGGGDKVSQFEMADIVKNGAILMQ